VKHFHERSAGNARECSLKSRIGEVSHDVLRLSGLQGGWSLGLLFPEQVADRLQLEGLERFALTRPDIETLEQFLQRRVTDSELRHFYALARPHEGAVIRNIPTIEEGFPVLFLTRVQRPARQGSFTIVQMVESRVMGGNTFFLRRTRS